MSPRAAITAVGGVAITAELCLGALGLASIGLEQIVLFLLASAVATIVITFAMRRLLRQPPEEGGHGGGGSGTGPDDPQPPWWPEFEADFRRYANDGRRTPA
jgi:hypothetical protein